MSLPDWARRLAREPLVHFLIGGAALFGWFVWQGGEADPAGRSITMNRDEVAGIAAGFAQQTGRAPTDQELDRLIDAAVREEVLYREALRLGLDQDDAVVRRRLAQKMDLIAGASAQLAIPSETDLQGWLEAHPARFSEQAAYTFDQIFFAERSPADLALQSQDLAAKLETSAKNRDIPARVSAMTERELSARFGQQFLAELEHLAVSEEWQGPIPSGLGWHLVKLTKVSPGKLPALNDVRQQVEDDWRLNTSAERKAQAYQTLRDAYSIEIDR